MAKKLQVFVSSTFEDLKQERQAAVAAILKAGHIPAGMELFTSGDQSQFETIKKWIDESDVYMLILGGRYGTLEPTSNIGYTEIEFDYAVRTGKPLFSVVIKSPALEAKVQKHGSAVIETVNGTSLSTFRSKVLSYTSSFFEDDKDIRLTVYESLADFSANKDLIGWVRGNSVVDTLPLFEEIKKLSEENRSLKSEMQEINRRAKATNPLIMDFEEISRTLNASKIPIPDELSQGKNVERTALDLFVATQQVFSTGFANKNPMDKQYKFLYFTLAPKLQIHSLVQFEKIAGAEYRRCSLTPKGAAFLSEFARRAAATEENSLAKDREELEHDKNVTEAPKVEVTPVAKKRASRKTSAVKSEQK